MELRDYLRVYWSQRWLILGIMVVAMAATTIVVTAQPVRYGVSESFAVNRLAQEATPDYQYDGYYALQAVELFSQTVVSWFNTPSILRSMYARANLDPEIQSLNNLPSRFRVKRYSPQNIVIRFHESTEVRASKLAAAMVEVLEERAAGLNLDPQGKPLFEIIGSTAVISPVKPNLWMAVAAAGVLSLVVGLFTAAARHYFRT